jgi:hypothetical protein
MDNRRGYPRHDMDWPILLREGAKTRRIGELVNISLNGLLMNISEPVPPESAGSFELFVCRPRSSGDMLEIHGRTVWMAAGGDDAAWALELTDLDEDGRLALSRFISEPSDLAIEVELGPL